MIQLNWGRLAATCAVSIFLMVSSTASAGTVFTDRVAFQAAAGSNIAGESFETAQIDLQNGPRTLIFSDFSVSYAGTGRFGVIEETVPSSGVGPTDGSQFLYADMLTSTNGAVTFTFAVPTTTFGVDLKDVEFGDVAFSTSGGDDGLAAAIHGNGGESFFGIIADQSFESITFTGFGDGVVFDAAVVGVSVVPTPGAAAGGLAMMGFAVLRRRR